VRAHPRLPTHLLRRVLAGAVAALIAVTTLRAAPPSIGIAVLHNAPWSPNAAAREGAGEFEVLLCVAQLQRDHAVAGLLSIGDHNGLRQCGGETALRRAALSGLPVVKLAPRGEVASTPDALFIDGGTLTEELAGLVLKKCLALFGAPPAAADPERPTARELAAIRAHLRSFQEAFASTSRTLVAAR
jgi:hypothetical protein